MYYVLQRAKTWAILDLEAPLNADGPEWADSTYGVMNATVPAHYAALRGEDGRRVLEKWGTLVHVETNSQRLWTGIISDIDYDGGEVSIEVREWFGYLDGINFVTDIRAVEHDPVRIIRDVVNHVQSFNDLGITVSGSTSLRLGTNSEILLNRGLAHELQVNGQVELAEASVKTTEGLVKTAEGNLKREVRAFDKLIKSAESTERTRKATYDKRATEDSDKAKELSNAKRSRSASTLETLVADRKTAVLERNSRKVIYDASLVVEKTAIKNLNTAIKGKIATEIAAARAAKALAQGDREAKRESWQEARTIYMDADAALIAARKNKNESLINTLEAQKVTTAARKETAQVAYDAARNAVRILRDDKETITEPLKTIVEDLKEDLKTARDFLKERRDELSAVQKDITKLREQVSKDGGAWKILAKDTPDCFAEIQDILEETGISLRTATKRVYGKPELILEAHYPSMGGDRSDLVFEQGVNIVSGFEVERLDAISEATVLGAGDIMQTTSTTTELVRRTTTVNEKRLTTKSKALSRARKLVSTNSGQLNIPEISIIDHPNCRIGAWNVGDTISLRGNLPGVGEVNLKHKIKSWRRVSEVQATLYLERA